MWHIWKRIKPRRRLTIIAAVVLLIPFFWFGINRATYRFKAVKLCRTGVSARPVDQIPETLTIVAYNIAHGRGTAESNWSGGDEDTKRQRLFDIAALLADADADIVVLNEVDFACVWSGHENQAEIIAQAAGFPYRVEQRNADLAVPFCRLRFGNAILSRYPVAEAELIDYPQESRWLSLAGGLRNGVLCRIRIAPNRHIGVIATHWHPSSPKIRKGSAQAILDLAEQLDYPVFIAGDFNTMPSNMWKTMRNRSLDTGLSCLLESHRWTTRPLSTPTQNDMTFPSIAPDRVIDWILVPEPWMITDKKVLRVTFSDHMPVSVKVGLNEE